MLPMGERDDIRRDVKGCCRARNPRRLRLVSRACQLLAASRPPPAGGCARTSQRSSRPPPPRSARCLAVLLLPTERPAFASIAAVVCLGVTYGQRRSRAIELIGGIVLGVAVASLLLFAIGTGPWQIALLVILAMSAALLFRGGELLVSEAAISAILLASFEPTTSGYSADRVLEGLIG